MSAAICPECGGDGEVPTDPSGERMQRCEPCRGEGTVKSCMLHHPDLLASDGDNYTCAGMTYCSCGEEVCMAIEGATATCPMCKEKYRPKDPQETVMTR